MKDWLFVALLALGLLLWHKCVLREALSDLWRWLRYRLSGQQRRHTLTTFGRWAWVALAFWFLTYGYSTVTYAYRSLWWLPVVAPLMIYSAMHLKPSF
jgi:hypothetical protein